MERADTRTATGRAQGGPVRRREGAFGSAVITAEVRYSLLTKHCQPHAPNGYASGRPSSPVTIHVAIIGAYGSAGVAAADRLADAPVGTDDCDVGGHGRTRATRRITVRGV